MPYTNGTVTRIDPPGPDGAVAIIISFTGDAGEPPVSRGYTLGPDDTKLSVRQWSTEQKRQLNGKRNAATVFVVGDVLAAVPPPDGPTAAEIAEATWRSKAARYDRMAGLGLTGQAATDLAALKADLVATYLTGYL